MYYIYSQSGHIISSCPTKEEADKIVLGTDLSVRPSYETIQLEKARQEMLGEVSPDESHHEHLVELALKMRGDYEKFEQMVLSA